MCIAVMEATSLLWPQDEKSKDTNHRAGRSLLEYLYCDRTFYDEGLLWNGIKNPLHIFGF
jgi:hypothetical protein